MAQVGAQFIVLALYSGGVPTFTCFCFFVREGGSGLEKKYVHYTKTLNPSKLGKKLIFLFKVTHHIWFLKINLYIAHIVLINTIVNSS